MSRVSRARLLLLAFAVHGRRPRQTPATGVHAAHHVPLTERKEPVLTPPDELGRYPRAPLATDREYDELKSILRYATFVVTPRYWLGASDARLERRTLSQHPLEIDHSGKGSGTVISIEVMYRE